MKTSTKFDPHETTAEEMAQMVAVSICEPLDDICLSLGRDWLETSHMHGPPLAWIEEGYTAMETAEGILSNAMIAVEMVAPPIDSATKAKRVAQEIWNATLGKSSEP